MNIEDKKVAFTLAEVLITLGIIGVVAAMTMPALIQKHQEQVTVNKVKAAYSIMSQAINLAIAENGDVSGWETEEVIENRHVLEGRDETPLITRAYKIDVIINKLKLAKNCGYDKDGCFAEHVKRLNGSKERDFNKITTYYNVILSNGISLSIQAFGDDKLKGEFWIDVNGLKQPNVVGKDIFLFEFVGNKVKAYQDYEQCTKNSIGFGCADWILSNGNMDYLKK
ncbi:type II secretion system protein [bacterium]|nr:type II secretion system protein [bacterium]